MDKKTKHATKFIAIAMALCTLTACPPEEDSAQQVEPQFELHKIEDYWPFEVGNFWQFVNTDGFSDGYQYTYEVLKDYSNEKVSAWGISHKSYDAAGTEFFDLTYYYVLREDVLVFTEHKAAMIEMLENPPDPIPTDILVQIIAPRIVSGGPEFQNYTERQYATAGPLGDLETYVDCGQPHDPAADPELQAIATLADGVCHIGGEPAGLLARRIFVSGIGPVRVNDLKLVYAIVGNREYDL